MLGGTLSLAAASQGGQVAWIVPAYRNGRSLWRWAERTTTEIRNAGLATANKTERLIEFTNGGFLGIYSADNPDSVRGEAFHLAILDEAARISEEAWTDAIQPTLADFDGDAILISTPKGMNWFYTEYQRGKDDATGIQKSWCAPSSRNPSQKIKNAFSLARLRVPERTFRQEWLAEFVEDGAYFQRVNDAAIIEAPDTPEQHEGHYLVAGVDWAKQEDYTVITVSCRECNRVVDWDRFNRIDFTYQRAKLQTMVDKWDCSVLPERNSIGEPNIEITRATMRVLNGPDDKPGFLTTATTKPTLIEGLAAGIGVHGYKIPVEYKEEMTSYQVEVMDSGRSKFGAPSGSHDDRVISAALSWWAMSRYQAPAGAVEEIDLSNYKTTRRR